MFPRNLKSIEKYLEISGFGIIWYYVKSKGGHTIELRDQTYYVPGLPKDFLIIYPQGIHTSERYKGSEGNEGQSVTSTSGEYLGSNVHARCSKRIIKSPQRYDSGFGADREQKNDAVANIVYMIQYGYLNRNVDTDSILLLLDECDEEYCMDTP